MRSKVHHHLLVPAAQHPRVRKRRHTRADLDRAATGPVQHTVLVSPAVRVPHPVGNRAVHEGRPPEDENHAGHDSTPLRHGTDRQRSSDSAEHHLVKRIEQSRNEGRSDRRGAEDALETEMVHVADEAVRSGRAEGEGEAPKVPLENDDAGAHHGDPEHGQGGLATGETGV